MPFVLAPPSQPKKGVVEFAENEFEAIIEHKGHRVFWEASTECPCANLSSHSVDASSPLLATFGRVDATPQNVVTSRGHVECPTCGGVGIFWHSAQEIRAVVTSSESKPGVMGQEGQYSEGSARFTTRYQHQTARMDRLTLIDQRHIFQEVDVRGEGVKSRLRYPIRARVFETDGDDVERAVLHLQVAEATGETLKASVLNEGVDFVVDEDGCIDWTLGDVLGSAPAEGIRFAVRYLAAPRYVVVSHPHVARDTWGGFSCPEHEYRPMPVLCVGQLEHLYFEEQ